MKTRYICKIAFQAPVFYILIWLCFLSLVSCRHSVDQKALKASIEEANALWMEAVRMRDTDALAALYTDDAAVLPANMKAINGREDVKIA